MTCVVVFNYYHLRVFVHLLDGRTEGFGQERNQRAAGTEPAVITCWHLTFLQITNTFTFLHVVGCLHSTKRVFNVNFQV